MTTPAPKRIRRSKELLGVSAVTFLAICIWVGPNAACWFIAIAAIIAVVGGIVCRRFRRSGGSPSSFLTASSAVSFA